MSEQRGFTLIELMVAIAVLAILVSVGIPSMVDFVRTNRRAAAVNALVTDLQRARSTAASSGTDVVLCHSTNGTSCSGIPDPDWSAGWILFVDDNGDDVDDASDDNGGFDAGEELLSVGARRNGLTMPSNGTAFRFNPGFGMLDSGSAGTVATCIEGEDNDRWIVVAPTGRPRLASEHTPEISVSCETS